MALLLPTSRVYHGSAPAGALYLGDPPRVWEYEQPLAYLDTAASITASATVTTDAAVVLNAAVAIKATAQVGADPFLVVKPGYSTKTIPVTSSSIRWRRASDDKMYVAGATDWIATGQEKGVYSGFLKAQFSAADWADIVKIVKAQLILVTPPDGKTAFDGVIPSNNARISLSILTQPFADNTETVLKPTWNGNINPTKGTLVRVYTVDNNIGLENKLDIREFVQTWAPTRVRVQRGTTTYKGLARANNGVQLQTTAKDVEMVVASELHSDPTIQPRILLTYEATPTPGVLFVTGPPATITQIAGHFFEADYIAGRATDRMTSYEIQVYAGVPGSSFDDKGTKAKWNSGRVAVSASESETSHMRYPLPVSLQSGVHYAWRARSTNQRGELTAWTASVGLDITANSPALIDLIPDGTSTYPHLNNVTFQAKYVPDSTSHSPLLRYRIQLASARPPDDSSWDLAGDLLWDTQERSATVTERTDGLIKLPYGGDGLPAGTYSWRIQAINALGAASPWTYPPGDVEITVGDQPDPGEADLLTGYNKRQVKARIVIRDMKQPTGAPFDNRRPGNQVAVLEDAANIGATEMHNAPGEFFFTLPATHPQVGVIEPFQVHYSLQIYRGQGWTEITAGVIVDFDATDDDVVFYGTDYLGMLEYDIDDRWNPSTGSGADAAAGLWPAPPGGSKYTNTVKEIVQDQIDRAIHHVGSPVGFITRGGIAAMPENIQIFSTFKSRLSFIAGLLDSHRGANLGLRTRLRVRRTTAGGYEFVVEDNPGRDRDNIRLSYGELIQGFRVIPMGDFGTRVFAIGRAFNSVKVEYFPNILGTAPEVAFGKIPKVNLWQDITDRNDLKRRAQLYARQISKIGKRMSLAIRVDALSVKDGWDICDSVPVAIDRGVVNTSNYGSGYWTIWGWTWQLYPDGHTDLTLSISPRLDTEPPDTSLIDSDPILDPDVNPPGFLGNYLWTIDRGVPPSGHASFNGPSNFEGNAFAGLQRSDHDHSAGTAGSLTFAGTYAAPLAGWQGCPTTGPLVINQTSAPFMSITVLEDMIARVHLRCGQAGAYLPARLLFINLLINGAVVGTREYVTNNGFDSTVLDIDLRDYQLYAGDVIAFEGTTPLGWGNSGTGDTYLMVVRGDFRSYGPPTAIGP